MKTLPIGIQSFWSIRTEKDYYYVDKTKYVKMLADNGKYYFLSRPRRFGKSLFLDTLRQAFLGKKELFKGLYLYDNWDWEKKYPVVYISFGSGLITSSKKLEKIMIHILDDNAENYNIVLKKQDLISTKFEELVKSLYIKYNLPVVVLVDEYDKPILDAIDNLDNAYENREMLKDFYSPLKDLDPYLKFVFLTGVSRFSKVSIFSGLNQLRDITLSKTFATICGYTESELENVFHDRIKDYDKQKIKEWYNGYSWTGERVYNPFDILLFFSEGVFKPFWFETGTPSFLVKMIFKNKFYLPSLENLKTSDEILSNLDIDFMRLENLLFQTGYLTIKDIINDELKTYYTLSYPNREVRMSLNSVFLADLFPELSKEESEIKIKEALRKSNLKGLEEALKSFFSSIPYHWYTKNELERYEGFYASIIYALFNGAGIIAIPEDTTNKGRIDLTAFMENKIYIVEFKVVDSPSKDPLKQIKEKKYYEKYMKEDKEIYIVGIELQEQERNIVGFSWEKIK
ncbi:ATP-binding protein [Hydrogenobaculum acidophilum]